MEYRRRLDARYQPKIATRTLRATPIREENSLRPDRYENFIRTDLSSIQGTAAAVGLPPWIYPVDSPGHPPGSPRIARACRVTSSQADYGGVRCGRAGPRGEPGRPRSQSPVTLLSGTRDHTCIVGRFECEQECHLPADGKAHDPGRRHLTAIRGCCRRRRAARHQAKAIKRG